MPDQQHSPRPEASGRPDILARRGFELAAIALGTAAGLFLAWRAAGSLLLVFAGLLFAAFLDACARGLGRGWSAPRSWRLAVVGGTLLLLAAGGVGLGGYTVAQQADQLFGTIQDQLRLLRGELAERGLAPGSGGQPSTPALPAGQAQTSSDGPRDGLQLRHASADRGGAPRQGAGGGGQLVRSFLPDPSTLLQSATNVLGATLGALGNLVVIVFLGLYVAADPGLYRRGALLLLPSDKRARIGAVLDECAETLRWYLLGLLVSMSAVAVLTFVGLWLAGVQGAFVLGLQAGLFAFVPYVGVLIGGAVIVLAALAQGGSAAMWALGVYAVVQMAESYVITPLVQRRTVDLAPALTIGALVVLGTLFGIWGLALGAPLLAALRVLILRLWIGDAQGSGAAASQVH